jgi:hypothetical protein
MSADLRKLAPALTGRTALRRFAGSPYAASDGFALRVRSAGKVVSVPVFGVVGVLVDGRKRVHKLRNLERKTPLSFCSSASWRAVKSSCAGSMAGRRSPPC